MQTRRAWACRVDTDDRSRLGRVTDMARLTSPRHILKDIYEICTGHVTTSNKYGERDHISHMNMTSGIIINIESVVNMVDIGITKERVK